MDVRGKTVMVVGLGRSGLALTEFLCARGARVVVTDHKSERELGGAVLARVAQLGVCLQLGPHTDTTLPAADLVLVSPGVPLSATPIRRARDAGIIVLGEVEFAARFLKGRLIGVTGSNGKTTVTSLIGAILSQAGFHTQVGGNIGTPLTSLIDASRDDGFAVVELSSFQLETIDRMRPHVAVMTNISPDHLDRHGSLSEYIGAKRRILLNQTREDWAVLNADDAMVVTMMYDTEARTILFSRRRDLDQGVFMRGDTIVGRMDDREEELIARDRIPLRGMHNVENVMAAMAAGWVTGAPVESMRVAVESFPGVEHRLEWLGQIDGVDYYNDSKATNVDSTIKALESFEGNLIVILGGRAKGSSFEPLRPLIGPRAKHVLLMGEASREIAEALHGTVQMDVVTSMSEAVERAHELAQPGDTVLLAPACASFDMFENFEHRGRVFKEEVKRLKLMGLNSSRLNLSFVESDPVSQ